MTTKPEHWTPLLEDTPRIQILNIKAAPFCSTHGLIDWLMNAFYLILLLKV
ncbi:hypothetical protein NP568_24535 [Vibrio parahaemolyticus]|nr:hypothetical protein [Vibrio parahaemolyticus]